MDSNSQHEARAQEVAYYTGNIESCRALLENLPTVWPEHLKQFRGRSDRHEAAAEIESLEDVEMLGLLTLRDDTESRLRAETFERAKALAILDSMKVDA